jgi:hypothetical protein
MRPLIALLGLAALIAGCADGAGADRDPPSGATGAPGRSGLPSGAPAPLSSFDPSLAAILDPVVADAATRLGVPPAAVAVVSVDAVTWSDGALGCPKPGGMYTQALVDGHRVVVAGGADGTVLDYRVTGPGAFRVCDDPEAIGG